MECTTCQIMANHVIFEAVLRCAVLRTPRRHVALVANVGEKQTPRRHGALVANVGEKQGAAT